MNLFDKAKNNPKVNPPKKKRVLSNDSSKPRFTKADLRMLGTFDDDEDEEDPDRDDSWFQSWWDHEHND